MEGKGLVMDRRYVTVARVGETEGWRKGERGVEEGEGEDGKEAGRGNRERGSSDVTERGHTWLTQEVSFTAPCCRCRCCCCCSRFSRFSKPLSAAATTSASFTVLLRSWKRFLDVVIISSNSNIFFLFFSFALVLFFYMGSFHVIPFPSFNMCPLSAAAAG